jgi:hypothetical protein
MKKLWDWIKKVWKLVLGILLALAVVLLIVFLVVPWVKQISANQQLMAEHLDRLSQIQPKENSDEQSQTETVVTRDPCNDYTVDLGTLGKYMAVYDSNIDACVLGIWQTSMIREGTGLYAWKESALSVTFFMPFDGVINNSANYVVINDVTWTSGNPAVDPDTKNPLVRAGTLVTIWTDGPNDSAGFKLLEKTN